MTFLRRKLLLAVTLATTAATLSLGQTPAPVGDTRAAQSATAIPDFSGLWTHAALGFESPISGPGPVRNLGRTPSGQSNFNQLIGDPTSSILQPWAADMQKKLMAIPGNDQNPASYCLPQSAIPTTLPFPQKIIQTPTQIIHLVEFMTPGYRQEAKAGSYLRDREPVRAASSSCQYRPR